MLYPLGVLYCSFSTVYYPLHGNASSVNITLGALSRSGPLVALVAKVDKEAAVVSEAVDTFDWIEDSVWVIFNDLKA
jgi:hypothetical protein